MKLCKCQVLLFTRVIKSYNKLPKVKGRVLHPELIPRKLLEGIGGLYGDDTGSHLETDKRIRTELVNMGMDPNDACTVTEISYHIFH